MPKHKTPETYGDLTKMIQDLQTRLGALEVKLKNKPQPDPMPDDYEPPSATFHAALVVPVPSEQWEC